MMCACHRAQGRDPYAASPRCGTMRDFRGGGGYGCGDDKTGSGRKRMKTFIAALLTLALAGAAAAQDWPTRPVTMVVPFAAGGPVDLVGRLFAQRFTEVLGQQVIIENVGGAGGSAGALRVAKAAPDGREFLLGNSGTHTYSQLLSKRPPYNAVADFAPVAVVVENSKFLVTRKDFPSATLPEFIVY